VSIATKQGDKGQTSLPGGGRVSKADLRVEAYGSIDELNATLGFARSICRNAEIASWTAEIQKSLFRVGSSLALPPTGTEPHARVTQENVDHLTDLVHAIEAQEGILSDWSLPWSPHRSCGLRGGANRLPTRRAIDGPTDRSWYDRRFARVSLHQSLV